jgi:N-succinyldiaminopimelate aminotransferase
MTAGTETIFTTMTRLAVETGAINLGQGFPDGGEPPALVEAAAEALRAGENQYAPLPGVPALREAIAAHQRARYGIELDPATQVQVTFGATEALACALLALVRPGDEVAMLDPSYDAYGAIVARAGGVARPIRLEPPGWRVTGADAIGPATRVLLLNSPHNPTGHVLARDELELLAAACIEHDVTVVTDEVYEHLVFAGEHVPMSTLPGMAERTLTISSLGKTHSVTGWKVGWATGPQELVAAVRGVKQFLSFSGGTPLQHAAAVGLALDPAPLRESLRERRDRLADGLTDAGFDVLPCQGTYFLSASLPGEPDAAALSLRLPHEAGVVAIPVSAFTAEPSAETDALLRFAFCKRPEVLDEAVARLRAWRA